MEDRLVKRDTGSRSLADIEGDEIMIHGDAYAPPTNVPRATHSRCGELINQTDRDDASAAVVGEFLQVCIYCMVLVLVGWVGSLFHDAVEAAVGREVKPSLGLILAGIVWIIIARGILRRLCSSGADGVRGDQYD